MADFAVADPEEGLNEQGAPNPITPSGFGENLGASLNTSTSGVFGGLGFLSRALGRSSAASGVPGYELVGPGAGFLPYDLHAPEASVSVPALQARFPDAKFKEPLPLTVATDLAKSQADAAKQANLYARYPNGFFANVPLVGSQIVAGLLDPVNDAAFMVPVVGETRYAQWLAGAGERAGLAGRLAVTAGVGGARGAAGATILAGAEAPLAANEDQPITLGQAGRDILSAGLGGALLHTGLSFHSDVLGARFAETGDGRAAAGSADLHDSAVQTAAAQMASGRPVEVQPVFDAARTRAELLGSTALTPVERDPMAGVRTENAISRAQGAPGQDELRWAGDAQAARAESDGLAVSEGQIAEARAAVEQMRAAGHLTPEDEDMLARLEQERPEGGGFRTNPMRIADEHDDEVRSLETQAFAGVQRNVSRATFNTPETVEAGAAADAASVSAAADEISGAKAALSGARTPTMLQTIRKAGGIALRDGRGEYTPEGTVVRQILDRNNRGIVNNKTGMRPDYMREHLAEQGWFLDHPGEEGDIQNLYDALDREARGEPVYHPTSETAAAVRAHGALEEDMSNAGITGREPLAEQARMLSEYRAAAQAEHDAWRAAADRAGIAHSPDALPEEILADAIEREAVRAEADGTTEEFGALAEQWIDQRIEDIDPDLAAQIRNEELEHEPVPEEYAASRAAAEGGGGPDEGNAGETGAEATGERAAGGGEPAQLEIPGSERSARQLAASRESAGAGRATARVEQQTDSVGLFAPPERNEPTLFQRGGEGRAAPGERVALNDDVIATLPTEPTAAERPILERVAQIAREMVPGAKVVAARALEPGEAIKDEFGDTHVTGAVYTNGVRRVIAWSLESADAEGTFRHEAVHWLNKEGFFAPEEWSALESAAQAGDWIGKHDIDGRYPTLDQTAKLEEAIADEFGAWRRAPDLVPEALRPIYQKLMELLARVADFVRGTFGANATANDIFSRLASGEVGARTPAETPRYGSTAFELTPEEQARSDMDAAVAARKKLTAYQDLQKRQALIDSVRNFHEQTVNRPTLRHPLAGIERRLPLSQSVDALTRGISEAVKGGRESTASEQLARANDFLGGFQTALDKIDGGMSAWRSRALTKDWVRELSELNKPGGRPGVSGSPMALEIARAVKQAQDVARMHLNRSGAWIGDYDGYVSRTAHNAVKIDRAGYPAWKEYTLARLDQDRTFADLDPEADRETAIDRFLHGVWDGLSTGIHLTSQEGVGRSSKAGAFSGPGNLGKRLSSERVLHWADADGWREYQEKFGDQVIERSVMNTLHRAATDSALMRRWGSNPQYTFDNLLRTIKEEYRDDHEGVRAFQASEARLRAEFAYLSGAGNMTGQSLAWKIRSSVLAWQDITKLGNVLFAHFSTFATKPFQLMYHGVGPWQAYTSTLRNFVQENTPEARSTLENLRSNATGLTQNILTGYEPIDGVPGRISGLRQKMMRLGGLPWALGLQKSGTEWELANFLGQRVGSEFGALHPATQRALSIYGIGEPEWDALRGAPGHDADGQGSTYLTPQAAARAPDAVIDGLTGGRVGPDTPPADAARIREETRDRLMMKLAAYYSESADRSTITPGVPERAVFSRIAGRFGGSIIGQYKTWATAAVRQIWGQALYGSSRGEALKALAGVIAVGTAAGYVRSVVTDLLSGKVPRQFNGDPANDAEILIGSMVKGSGMGILGDMILGQFEANAGSGKERALKYIAQLAGPLIGDVADLGGVAFDYATAPLQKHPAKAARSATANALHEVQQHLPLVNLFYVRTIMNWLIWDRLYEMASPGYLKRYQAHVKQMSHGQSYLTLPGGYQPGAPTQYLGHATAPVAQ